MQPDMLEDAIEAALKHDLLTDTVTTTGYAHHEAHNGSAYHARVSVATATQAAISAAFKIPDTTTKELHLIVAWTSESKAHLEIYEDATWTTNTGTARDIINAKRASANESVIEEDKSATPDWGANMALLETPTKTGGTLLLPADYTWADKKAGGGKSRGASELILKPDSAYLFLLTSDDGDKGLQIDLDWYEHTPEC